MEQPLVAGPPASVDRRYRYWRVRVMYAMMVGYATFYFVRNNMAMANKPIVDEFHFSHTEWAAVISVGTIVYGICKFLSGVLADVFKPKYIMSLGLFVSALSSILFSFGHSLRFFFILWTTNSIFQGMGMTPCSRLITFWFSPRETGRAWGIWNASHQIGGGVIAWVGAILVYHYGWRADFWVPGLFALVVSLWLVNRLPHSPESMGLPPVEVYKGDVPAAPPAAKAPFREIFLRHIVGNPWVWLVSVANFFVYVVRIGMLTWGPMYLQESRGFGVRQSGRLEFVFEIVGIFGALAAGWLSDRVFRGRRGPAAALFMTIATGSVLGLFAVPHGNALAMMVVFGLLGFFVYGPQLLVAVAAADFATKEAAATAVGLTGLFGYAGATACSMATGVLVDHWGWRAAIWFYAGSAAVGTILLAALGARRSPILEAAHQS